MKTGEIIEKISRGTTEIINVETLSKKIEKSLKTKKPLLIKAGFDPTAPNIHLGHFVLLRKLRQLQDLGHQVYFLIGDFTAQIGDPTGRDQTRPVMTRQQILQNAKTYKAQIFKILDPKRTKIIFNSVWLDKLSSHDVLNLSRRTTVAQMLARADFKKRFQDEKEISLLEFFYPLLQGYDSVHLKADVELGGSDQKFNLLMGRQLQEAFGLEPQAVIMTPLLEGTDGVNKMSKSLGNDISINESPKEIFGKLMSIRDDLMYRYYELLTDDKLNEIKALHPKTAKLQLAEKIVKQFHDPKESRIAREDFEKTFSQRQIPDDISEYRFHPVKGESLADILVTTGVAATKNEVRRLIKQGAVTFDGHKIDAENWPLRSGVLKVGKRRFLKLIE